jgi:Mn-dependent DtxR family transcriptional regulator
VSVRLLARWKNFDRDLTQEVLSQMLAVQRSSVTPMASKPQEAGLITYRCGRIHVLDAKAL